MQKKYFKVFALCCVIAISLVAIHAQAEEGSGSGSSGGSNGILKPKIENRIETRVEMRKDIKQLEVEKRGEIKDIRTQTRGEVKDIRMMGSESMIKREIREGSTTDMFRRGPNRGEDGQGKPEKKLENKLDRKVFQIRKDALVKQLNIAIENLTNIGARIAERIVKAEASGKTMTDAKASLDIANEKLVKAKAAVATLAAYTPPTATSTATATVEVNVEKPRQVGDAAIKAVKEARDAFKKVIEDIARAMGLGNRNASSTPDRDGDDDRTSTSTIN